MLTVDLHQPNAIHRSPDRRDAAVEEPVALWLPLGEPKDQGHVHTGGDGDNCEPTNELGQERRPRRPDSIGDSETHHRVSYVRDSPGAAEEACCQVGANKGNIKAQEEGDGNEQQLLGTNELLGSDNEQFESR